MQNLPIEEKKIDFFLHLYYYSVKRDFLRVVMTINYNAEKLKEIVDDICTLTGVAISIIDNNFNTLYTNKNKRHSFCALVQSTPTGAENCKKFDSVMLGVAKEGGRPFSHICHAGLFDTSVPIIKNGITAGYILLGGIRATKEPDEKTLTRLYSWGLDEEIIKKRFDETVFLSEAERASLLRLVSAILFDHAIEIDFGELMNGLTEYIEKNLSNELSIEMLCKAFFISKSRLYASFHSYFGKTPNEYITERRISKAKELLNSGSESITEIAEAVGIGNYAYFSKLFKKRTGITPKKYKLMKDE